MTFDNTLEGSESTMRSVVRHLPIAVAIGAVALIFIGAHAAATSVVAIAAVHLVAVVGIVGFRRLHAKPDEAAQ